MCKRGFRASLVNTPSLDTYLTIIWHILEQAAALQEKIIRYTMPGEGMRTNGSEKFCWRVDTWRETEPEGRVVQSTIRLIEG